MRDGTYKRYTLSTRLIARERLQSQMIHMANVMNNNGILMVG
jgi:hypothetical protein